VITFNTFAARLPVTETFVAVVEPIVDEPVVNRLPNAPIPVTVVEAAFSATTAPVPAVKLASVVEARVEEPVIAAFVPFNVVTNSVVLVEFVIVPLVALIFESDKLPAERVVIVALVIVPLVETRFVIFPVEMYEVDAYDVEALVVLAYTLVN
jgi:hypothetical protein